MNHTRLTLNNKMRPLGLALVFFVAVTAAAQTTEFTFQGSLKDGASPANGNYDFEFLLFDALAGGGQVGSTRSLNAVPVSAGVFSVRLDFGDQFPAGANRWLEIRVRMSGAGGFTILAPRSPVGTTPLAVRSLNANTANAMSATCIGCVNAANIASVNGAAVTGPIPVDSVPGGSTHYIRNSASMQPSSAFNIAGDGTAGGRLSANVVNATTRYDIGGVRVLTAQSGNLTVGLNAGTNDVGSLNSFVGFRAGNAHTSGSGNSFFGSSAGGDFQTGGGNSFFGQNAGGQSISGNSNSFFGSFAGNVSSGNNNSFFGREAGKSTTGDDNSFFGSGAGAAHTASIGNSFFGRNAGAASTFAPHNSYFGSHAGASGVSSSDNSFFGFEAGLNNTGFCCNSFFGSRSGMMNTTGASNSFFGNQSGQNNTTGDDNAFFGAFTGPTNTTGSANAFFGRRAGMMNLTGANNAFFGAFAGRENSLGNFNAYFGRDAGLLSNGSENAFFGYSSGSANSTGVSNSFFGGRAGNANTTGNSNSFFGLLAGNSNVTGTGNTIIGSSADVGSPNLFNATAIGLNAFVSQSNSLVLGSIAGLNNAGVTVNVGIGTATPEFRLDIADRIRIKQRPGATGTTLTAGLFLFQNTPNAERAFIGMENDNSVGFFGNNGGGWSLVMNTQTGITSIRTFAAGGVNAICRTATSEIGFCSSSLRYKTNIAEFTPGISFVNRLSPISFDWKEGSIADIGFGAEDVAKIDPRFVTYNDKGEVEGVKYDRLSVVFVNAIKEQQKTIERQQSQIDELKKLVCEIRPTAEVCKEVQK